MTLLPRQRIDVVAVAAPDRVILVRVVGRNHCPLVHLPINEKTTPATIARILGVTLHASVPDRILLSILDETDYEQVAGPVIDACERVCQPGQCEMVWLPDLVKIADRVRGPTANPAPHRVRHRLFPGLLRRNQERLDSPDL